MSGDHLRPVGVRVVGVFAALSGAVVVALILLNAEARAAGGRDLTPLLPLGVALILVGFGMFRCSRLAALLLSAPLAVYGVSIVGACILAREWWALLLNGLLVLPLFLTPALVTAAEWRRMRWLGGGGSGA